MIDNYPIAYSKPIGGSLAHDLSNSDTRAKTISAE